MTSLGRPGLGPRISSSSALGTRCLSFPTPHLQGRPWPPELPETSRETPREGGAGTTGDRWKGKRGASAKEPQGHRGASGPQEGKSLESGRRDSPTARCPNPCCSRRGRHRGRRTRSRRPPPAALRGETQSKAMRPTPPRPGPAHSRRGPAPPARPRPGRRGAPAQKPKGGAGRGARGWNLKDPHPLPKPPRPSCLPHPCLVSGCSNFPFSSTVRIESLKPHPRGPSPPLRRENLRSPSSGGPARLQTSMLVPQMVSSLPPQEGQEDLDPVQDAVSPRPGPLAPPPHPAFPPLQCAPGN